MIVFSGSSTAGGMAGACALGLLASMGAQASAPCAKGKKRRWHQRLHAQHTGMHARRVQRTCSRGTRWCLKGKEAWTLESHAAHRLAWSLWQYTTAWWLHSEHATNGTRLWHAARGFC